MTNMKRKSLYIFLTSLLGMLLFLMLHRSLFVVYEILGNFFPGNIIFDVQPQVIFSIDFFSMILAMFIGGWYGVWLGLDWYKMIYEEREGRQWFHGFLPHHWRGYGRNHKSTEVSHSPEPEHAKTKSTNPKRIVVKGPTLSSSRRIESFASFKAAPTDKAWSLEDVESTDSKTVVKPKRKAVVKKRVVKRKVAK